MQSILILIYQPIGDALTNGAKRYCKEGGAINE